MKLQILPALLATLLLIGCGEKTFSKADVETGSMEALSKKVGQPSPQITCPNDMKAKVGEKMICSMPINAKTYDVTITVSSLGDNNIGTYDVEVASAPRP
jgi:Domain of unknown function (DUF4333)